MRTDPFKIAVVGFVVCIGAFFLILAASAQAASHDPRLDAVATAVAGHPVTAVCADTNTEWVQWQQQNLGGLEADGYTYISVPDYIYLAPFVCRTLRADLGWGPTVVGNFWLALAIKTILHEAVHQQGQPDEAVTDCAALALVKQYAVSTFGYTETITKQVIASKIVKKKRVYYLKTVTVPNPALEDMYQMAVQWHKGLPANYQGVC